MTADPPPDPTKSVFAEALHVVRVRVRTHGWASPGLSLADAEHLAGDVTRQLADVGGSYGFVEFAGREKRLQIRAREVIAVEIVPEMAERADHRPTTDGSSAAPVSGGAIASGGAIVGGGLTMSVNGAVPTDGTAFLRQQAAGQAHRTGSHRSPR